MDTPTVFFRLGFPISRTDFWAERTSKVRACPRGCPIKGRPKFCPNCGSPTRHPVATTPTALFKKLAGMTVGENDLDLEPGDVWETLIENCHDDYDLNHNATGSLCIFRSNRGDAEEDYDRLGILLTEGPTHTLFNVNRKVEWLTGAITQLTDLRDKLGLSDREINFYISLE